MASTSFDSVTSPWISTKVYGGASSSTHNATRGSRRSALPFTEPTPTVNTTSPVASSSTNQMGTTVGPAVGPGGGQLSRARPLGHERPPLRLAHHARHPAILAVSAHAHPCRPPRRGGDAACHRAGRRRPVPYRGPRR